MQASPVLWAWSCSQWAAQNGPAPCPPCRQATVASSAPAHLSTGAAPHPHPALPQARSSRRRAPGRRAAGRGARARGPARARAAGRHPHGRHRAAQHVHLPAAGGARARGVPAPSRSARGLHLCAPSVLPATIESSGLFITDLHCHAVCRRTHAMQAQLRRARPAAAGLKRHEPGGPRR
jgi:hypothetical protein